MTHPGEMSQKANFAIFASQFQRRRPFDRRKGTRELRAWSEPPSTWQTDGQFQGLARSVAAATQGERHLYVVPQPLAQTVS